MVTAHVDCARGGGDELVAGQGAPHFLVRGSPA
jgi:hypothetical protein